MRGRSGLSSPTHEQKNMRNASEGHLAVITGASSGLGEQYARQLAAGGASLIIAARRIERLAALAAELGKAHGTNVQVIRSDLSRREAAQELFEAATSGGRHVTMLVNNAGSGPFRAFVD